MGEVIDIAIQIEERKYVEALSVLYEKARRNREDIMADPMPLLNALAGRIMELEVAVKNATVELAGVVAMSFVGECVAQSESIGALAFRRNQAATEILVEIMEHRP